MLGIPSVVSSEERMLQDIKYFLCLMKEILQPFQDNMSLKSVNTLYELPEISWKKIRIHLTGSIYNQRESEQQLKLMQQIIQMVDINKI